MAKNLVIYSNRKTKVGRDLRSSASIRAGSTIQSSLLRDLYSHVLNMSQNGDTFPRMETPQPFRAICARA